MERPFAITLGVGSSRANHTGSWRVERPVYLDRLPPCNDACPAGENVQRWLYHAEAGDYELAWRALVEDNPLPATMGRVCFHPCETACNRARLDEAVGINAVERFLGDLALERGWQLPAGGAPSGRRVLVVGAGPGGLSAAYHLARLGHHVVIADANAEPGGMMRYGIPAYRLPRDVLAAEIARLEPLGIELELGHSVTDLAAERREGRYDAVYLGVGAQLASRTAIPAGDSARILDALSLLRGAGEGAPGGGGPGASAVLLGRRVAVYGGGDTAMDAARTAKRLGATDPVIVYRRTREVMPAHEEELEQALEEGITVRWLSRIGRFESGRLLLEKMALGTDGKPVPTGEVEELVADALVLAIGESADLSLVQGLEGVQLSSGSVLVDAAMMTGAPGVFAGGDAVPGSRTVTDAVGQGKAAARGIARFLTGTRPAQPPRHELAAFERLNTWYYDDAPRAMRPRLDAARRQSGFDEVVGSLDESTALFEARRCMSCGNCFECDNCYGVCPDNAVLKLELTEGRRYGIDYDFCKGCGICAAECPCGAIEMVPELV